MVNIANIPWIKLNMEKALYHNPGSFFKKGNIKFQFDMFHGCGVLEKAINLYQTKIDMTLIIL